MGPRFEKIPYTKEGLRELEELLLARLPLSIHMLVLCQIAKEDRFSKKVIVQFYKYANSTSEELRVAAENDPFIVCLERPNLHTKKGVILLSPQNPTDIMIQTFDNFIGWDRDQVFQTVQSPLWEHIQRLCEKHRNSNPDNSLGIPGILLAMSKEQAEKIHAPVSSGNVVVRSLEDGDVGAVLENWKWSVDHTEMQVKETIKTLVSCGVFVNEEGKEKLASCVILSPLGSFNVLQTMQKYRRRGFADMVMRWASKQAAIQLGVNPVAEVEVFNDVSKSLLEKVGYKEMYTTRWYYYVPTEDEMD